MRPSALRIFGSVSIDFIDVFDSSETVVFRDDRKDYGEPRFILGRLHGWRRTPWPGEGRFKVKKTI